MGLIKSFFLAVSAFFFPWIVLLIYDNPVGAFLALVLQATLIGWPFASIWALREINNNRIISYNFRNFRDFVAYYEQKGFALLQIIAK